MENNIISYIKNISVNGLDQYSEQTIAEGIRFLYENIRSLALGLTILPLLLTAVMWNQVDNTVLIIWVLIALTIRMIRQWLAYLYFKVSPTPQEAVQWGRYFTYSSILMGTVYGSTAILFFTPDSLPTQLFIFILIIGMANAVFVSAHWLESYYAFVIPCLLLPSIHLLMQADSLYKALSIVTLTTMIMAFFIGKKTQRSVLSSIQLRYENNELLEQLKLSMGKAEEANKRKTRFLASASHDLRQPVHALELFSESFESAHLTREESQTLQYMKDCISSLNELLSSLLDISRLDAGIVKPSFAHIDAYQLISRVANNLKGQAEGEGLTLKTHGQSLWVNSDSVLLENSVRNLLTNAIKYTNKGRVIINCRARNKEVWIEVWDTGIGIADDEISNVFDEFYQINNSERDRRQGLGLGLSIVSREMDMLGHDLSLRSCKGKGTLVTIKLQRVSPKQSNIEQTASEQIYHRLENKKVLIIDDEESILIATKVLVKKWGCHVEVAVNLDEASAICRTFIPDIIISDLRLREHVTGIEVIEQLRIQLDQNIPAILITGDTAPDRLQQAKESQLMLLHKPVKPVKLKVAMNMVLNSKQV